MKTPQHIFALTRNEQRVVILIVVALVGLATVRQYFDRRSRPSARPAATTEQTLPVDREPDSPNDSR